jgi:hypothetical protein
VSRSRAFRAFPALIAATAALLAARPGPARAQRVEPPAPAAVPVAAPAAALAAGTRAPGPRGSVVGRTDFPFGVGERLEYDAKVGPLRVGRGSMEIVGVDPVRGKEAVHIAFRVSGGALGFHVDDAMDSWVDPKTFNSLRFVRQLKERGKQHDRTFEIFPERGVFRQDDEEEQPTVARPLDDGAFFYFVRTVPLVVGEVYEFDRYFRPDRNPVRVRVLRRERVKVPAGEFDAIVIQPVIKTKGLFAESARTELWLTDDDRRILLKMVSQLPFGSLSLHLKRATETGGATP